MGKVIVFQKPSSGKTTDVPGSEVGDFLEEVRETLVDLQDLSRLVALAVEALAEAGGDYRVRPLYHRAWGVANGVLDLRVEVEKRIHGEDGLDEVSW